MTSDNEAYPPGEWIVHRHHGVGQIKGYKVMRLGGKENRYCEIETLTSTIWMPPEKLNEEWLRPLSSPGEMQKALQALSRRPRLMDSDITKRKSRISSVGPSDSPVVIAEIVRDLSAHNKEKRQASQTDVAALRYLTGLFLGEWSICMNLKLEDAEKQLHALLAGT